MFGFPALNANASPFVPIKKPQKVQWGTIGEEKKKIKELESEIDRIQKELVMKETYIDDLRKIIDKLEISYKSIHEENNNLKISNNAYTAANELIKKEKEDFINTQGTKYNQTINMINKLWCEQIINALLKNAFYGIYHPEIMMIKHEVVNNNNFNVFQRIIEIVSSGIPYSPFITTFK